jgi:hypothetical protein
MSMYVYFQINYTSVLHAQKGHGIINNANRPETNNNVEKKQSRRALLSSSLALYGGEINHATTS